MAAADGILPPGLASGRGRAVPMVRALQGRRWVRRAGRLPPPPIRGRLGAGFPSVW